MVGPNGAEGFRDIRYVIDNAISPAGYLGVIASCLFAILVFFFVLERSRFGLVAFSTRRRCTGSPLQYAAGSAARALRVRAVRMNSSDIPSLLYIRALKKNFGALRAIDNLHLDVDSGGIFGIIGPNGSGKTTLFNVISGVCQPAAGTVHHGGQDLTGLCSNRVARHGIARTFQNLRIFRRLNVLENVMGAQTGSAGVSFLNAVFPQPSLERERRGRAPEILERVGLADRAAYWPRSFRSASSGGWNSHGQWRGSLPRSCSTSRPAA